MAAAVGAWWWCSRRGRRQGAGDGGVRAGAGCCWGLLGLHAACVALAAASQGGAGWPSGPSQGLAGWLRSLERESRLARLAHRTCAGPVLLAPVFRPDGCGQASGARRPPSGGWVMPQNGWPWCIALVHNHCQTTHKAPQATKPLAHAVRGACAAAPPPRGLSLAVRASWTAGRSYYSKKEAFAHSRFNGRAVGRGSGWGACKPKAPPPAED